MGHLYFYVVFGCVIFALAGSWMYFRRYQLSRPPLGVINLWDIAVMILAIIALPFLYLALPVWVVATLLALTALSVLYFTVQSLVPARWAIWIAAVFLLLTDCAAVYLLGDQPNTFFGINNLTLIILVVGIANLWAQSGLKARDSVVLGVALAVYDFVATAQSPLMSIL